MSNPRIRSDDLAFRRNTRSFVDRRSAGRELAQALQRYRGQSPLVLGLPRGGVPIADEIARAIGGTLDVWVVRKLGAPWQPELGMGAIAEGPAVVLDRYIVGGLGVSNAQVCSVARREMVEVARRVERFRGGRPEPDVHDRVVILVDDGIATGGTMRAAIRAIKKRRPSRLVVAVPVAAPDTVADIARTVDEVVCLQQIKPLYAIGLWYADFAQLTDDEVTSILAVGPVRPRA